MTKMKFQNFFYVKQLFYYFYKNSLKNALTLTNLLPKRFLIPPKQKHLKLNIQRTLKVKHFSHVE